MARTIADIAKDIGSGLTPLRSNPLFWNSHDIPWLKTEQLGAHAIYDTKEYISQSAMDETSIKLWPSHTVSVAMYGEGKTRGSVSIIMSEMTTNQACCNVIVDDSLADYSFLYYWLKYNYEQLRSLASGVRKNLNSDDIKNFQFPDFDLDNQISIAEVLSSIDDKIDCNSKICTELDSMAKALYDYWFVQFDFPDENGKPYRTNGGRMTWCEEMKKHIPEEWKVERISELLEKIPKSLRIKTEGYHKDGSIAIIDQSERYIAGYTNDYSAKIYKEDGYIIFGDHTRVVKYIRFPFARGADGTQVLSSNDERMPNELFYQAIKSIDLSNQGYARHYKFLIENVIILPDRVVARHYKETVVPLYEKYRQIMFENIELQRLRDWLLPMLMNGQATITYTDNERTSI